MTRADFEYGALLLEKERGSIKDFSDEYLSKEGTIKALCNECLGARSKEGIDRLNVLAFVHDVGKRVIADTNWGRVVGFSLILHNACEDPSASFILKVSNLDQLLYLMRTMRFLCYRQNLLGDRDAGASLEGIFDEFGMPEKLRTMIKDAARVPNNA